MLIANDFTVSVKSACYSLIDAWPLKALGALLCWLIGPITPNMISLAVLVMIDTLTRWAAIVKISEDKNELLKEVGWLYTFVHCWRCGTLNSYKLRTQFLGKIIAYSLSLIVAAQLGRSLPATLTANVNLSYAPLEWIIAWLALTETISILENMCDMGVDAFRPVLLLLNRKKTGMIIDCDRSISEQRECQTHKDRYYE